MTKLVTIELGGPPQGKGRGRAFLNRGTGRIGVHTPAGTRTYEAQLRYAATQEMAGCPPTKQPVSVVMTVRFPFVKSWTRKQLAAAQLGHARPTKKPDADNTLKLCDALNGIVWRDDAQVVDARVRKVYAEAPGLIIEVSTIGPAQPALPLTPEEEAADSSGSYYDAIAAIRDQVKAGAPVPTTGYFSREPRK